MYLTYTEYQNMGGTLDETAFDEFEFEAECMVNWYTFSRLQRDTEYPETVKRCMYALIKLAKKLQDASSLGEDASGSSGTSASIASQSNDGVSISYNVMSASDLFEKYKDEMINVIKRYLQGVTNSFGHKLLYRGIYPNE